MKEASILQPSNPDLSRRMAFSCLCRQRMVASSQPSLDESKHSRITRAEVHTANRAPSAVPHGGRRVVWKFSRPAAPSAIKMRRIHLWSGRLLGVLYSASISSSSIFLRKKLRLNKVDSIPWKMLSSPAYAVRRPQLAFVHLGRADWTVLDPSGAWRDARYASGSQSPSSLPTAWPCPFRGMRYQVLAHRYDFESDSGLL